MRFSVLVFAAILLAGCASGNKSSAPTSTSAPSEPQAVTAPATVAKTSKLSCSHKSDSRILELREKGAGCELGYTKSGKEAVVATSLNGLAHCEKTMTRIKDKLTASGFTCQ